MPSGPKRDRTLYGLGAKRASMHRYTVIRWVLGVVLTIAVALLPLTGTLRFDLWSGRNHWLGESAGLVETTKAFAFPFLAINIVIIIASRFLGRWLCGFVCPIGNMNRLAEWFRWRFKKSPWIGTSVILFLSLLLGAITFSFWIDWRVFRDGSPVAIGVALAFLAGTAAVLFLVVRGLGMQFCRDYCPSGVYFALLGPTSNTGIEFAAPDSCTDCHACESVCPVDLQPREMASEEKRPGCGVYPGNLTNFANCIRCGDCVAVCEDTTGPNDGETPLRMGWLPEGARGSMET